MTANSIFPALSEKKKRASTDGALDVASQQTLNRLARLASQLQSAPVALVSIVESDRQIFAASIGLSAPYESITELPLSYSICKIVQASGRPFIVDDVRTEPQLRSNLAVSELGVRSYLGVPLRERSGRVFGSFCVCDTEPRVWTERQLATLDDLAQAVMAEFDNRAAYVELNDAKNAFRDLLDTTTELVCSADSDGVITYVNQAWSNAFGYSSSEAIGMRSVDLLAAEHRARFVEIARRLHAGETIEAFECVAIGRNDRRIVCRGRATATMRTDEYGRTGCVGTRAVYRDMTAERVNDEERARLVAAIKATRDAQDRAAAAVHESEARLALVYRNVSDLLALMRIERGADGHVSAFRCELVNDALAGTTGRATSEYIGRTLDDMATPANLPMLRERYRQVADEGIALNFELMAVGVHGPFYVETTLTPVRDSAGVCTHVLASSRDVTQRRAAEAALREGESAFRAMLQTLRAVAVTLDIAGRVTFANEALLSLSGWKQEHVIGCDWFQQFVPDAAVQRNIFEDMIEDRGYLPHRDGEIITCSGRIRTIEWDTTLLRDASGNISGSASIGHDVTDQRALEARLEALSEHDELTGLLNRRGFLQRVEEGLAQSRRTPRTDALLYIDLDRFKPINDTYGHAAGDDALRAVSALLVNTVRETDFVGRLGGDEFAVYAPNLAEHAGAMVLADRIESALAAHNTRAMAEGRSYAIEFSVGIAEVASDSSCDSLFAAADTALYAKKRRR